MSTPVAEAIRLLREAAEISEYAEYDAAADALAAYFAEPQDTEVERLRAVVEGTVDRCGVHKAPWATVTRAVLRTILGEQP